ncbi:MAG: sulfatase-like hydrolase/transferase [Eubacteriaceae bacterium]|nr:sulfatase-like hydrolase/transferase [Eubacteriaceae bacterium]
MKKTKILETNFYFSKIILIIFFSLIFIEGFFKILTFGSLFTIELVRITLFTLTTSTIIAFLCSFFSPRMSKVIILMTILFSSIYAVIQLNFQSFMGNYMSVNAANDGAGRITEQISVFLSYIKPIYYLGFLPFMIVLLIFIFAKGFLRQGKYNFKQIVTMFIFVISLHFLSISTLILPIFQSPNLMVSNQVLYSNPIFIETSLKEFGTMRFLWRDILYMIDPGETSQEIVVDDKEEEEVIDEPDYERKIIDTRWRTLIENEKDPVIKSLHEFYINQNITPKNEMTGIFKDKNLILIMIEALDVTAINEEVTPTLFRLAKEGWYFNNYYTPKYSCTTGESEYIALTSIIPSPTVCTPNAFTKNNYSTSIFSLFKKNSYYNTSYHNWTDQYYNRTELHQNMGSLKFYSHDDLNIKRIGGWPSDLNMMQEALPYFIDQDRFFSFIITSTMHFPYDDGGHKGVVKTHWDKVKNLPYNIKVKRYLAKAIETDLALEYLINSLEEKGKLDDTVFAIFGDHHPLHMELKYLEEATGTDRTSQYNMDRLPFIIYNSAVESKTITKTASTFDILPTLANLFDLNYYDPRYYVGKDVFSEEETTVIFTTGGWITDKAMYFPKSGTYERLSDTVTDEYLNGVTQKVKNYMNVSAQTLTRDYFRYRFPSE